MVKTPCKKPSSYLKRSDGIDDVPTMEEDAVRRAIQASRQADSGCQEEDEHVGTTTMVGGATSSTSRLPNSTTLPARTATPSRRSMPAPTTTGRTTHKGEGKHGPDHVRDEPAPGTDKTRKTKGNEDKRPTEGKRQRRSGDVTKGSGSIRKYLGDTCSVATSQQRLPQRGFRTAPARRKKSLIKKRRIWDSLYSPLMGSFDHGS